MGQSPRPGSELNVQGLVCLVVLGLQAAVILLTPFIYRAVSFGDRFAVVTFAITTVSMLLALTLVLVGAYGARTTAAPTLRWAAIGGLVCGAFTLVVQAGSFLVNWLMFGTILL